MLPFPLQPRSTLLLLVGAFLGGMAPVHALYRHALRSKSYRFLSYGDANLLIPPSRALLKARVQGSVPGVGSRGQWTTLPIDRQ